MTHKRGFILPIFLMVLLFLILGTFVYVTDKKKEEILVQKEEEITSLKNQIKEFRDDYQNPKQQTGEATIVEVVDPTSLKGDKVYPLKCYRTSQGYKLNFAFIEESSLKNEDIFSVCENKDQNGYLVVTYRETNKGGQGTPSAGIFSFKTYSSNDKTIHEIATKGGGLYSWCDDIIALTKDNNLFVRCTETIYRISVLN
ncbi:hypothetical protein A2165_01835 [Candidatus Curtissbacteria bacterium RBG_13_40_7]|uniref:Uncharacterized protein n=1 Tax=Candidatus Curtissbacteria bacterium RBG_13_40_7 TaxID=1797706 RepID=A0A1F5FWN9_9BACT|nr:MAG: hypothetical protein A2165_01835 [Candidatus Curtissbacteria bacterium RBG_13_40_7]